jgi:hypothetical protein
VIWVDELRACGAPWKGGVACHMVSDDSIDELVSFASALGLRRSWFQGHRGSEHYDLSPKLRAKALRWGARECMSREMVGHSRRCREAEQVRRDTAVAELEARTGRHHGTECT